jgi:hypothetical protein
MTDINIIRKRTELFVSARFADGVAVLHNPSADLVHLVFGDAVRYLGANEARLEVARAADNPAIWGSGSVSDFFSTGLPRHEFCAAVAEHYRSIARSLK